MKKLSIVLSVLLLLALCLTACKPAATDAKPTAEPSSQAGEPTEQTGERVSLRIAYWGANAFGDDQFYQDISDKFNLDIEFINLEWSDFAEQLRLWAASGEFPDVAAGPLPSNDYFNFANQGVVAPIPEDLSAYPNLDKFENQELMELFRVDGKLYAIPRTHNRIYGEDAIPSFRWVIRKDWMSQAGYQEVPDTYPEFMDMIQKMAELKLGGEGTVGLTDNGVNGLLYPFLFGMQKAPLTWTQDGGEWVPSISQASNAEWISFVKKYYDAGAIDKDVVIYNQGSEGYDKFNSGKAAAILISMTAADWYNEKVKFEAGTGLVANDTLVLSSPFLKTDADATTIQRQMDPLIGTGTYFSASITPEKMDRALQLIDYFLSDEGLQHCKAGLEGRDFKLENGEFVNLMEKDPETGEQKTSPQANPTASLFGLAYWATDYALQDPSVEKESREQMQATYDWIEDNCQAAERNLEIEWWGGSEDFTSWSYETAWYAGIANILAKSNDVPGDYQKLVDELMASGGTAAKDAVNKQFQ